MDRYIVFAKGQIKLENGRWKYESNTKYRITNEDNQYYYVQDDKFDKSNKEHKVGNIAKEFKRE